MASSRTSLVAEGVIFIILGILAISLPTLVGMALTMVIGVTLLIAGVVHLFRVIKTRTNLGFIFPLLAAILAIIIGCLMLFYPLHGVVILSTLLVIWLLAHGLMQFFSAIQMRKMNPNWGVMLISGIISILLGSFLILSWPVSSLILLGLLFGVNLMFYGLSLCAIGFLAKAH